MGCFFNEVSIRFKNQGDSLLKIRAGFLKRGPLGIGTRQFLDEADVPLGDLLKYRSQIQAHDPIIRFGNEEADRALEPMAPNGFTKAAAHRQTLTGLESQGRCAALNS